MKYSDLTYENIGSDIHICLSKEHRFGTDAFLLANFSKARHKDKCADFCSGCGIIAFLLQKYFAPTKIYAIEIQEKAFDQINFSIEKSNLKNVEAYNTDLKSWKSPCELDIITCNPPYKIENTGIVSSDTAAKIARHEIMCTLDDVCKSAAKSLKFGGKLCICNRPERLCDIFFAMRNNGIEPKRIRFVQKKADTAPWLVLCEGNKGGKPFLTVEKPFLMQNFDGTESNEVKNLYSYTDEDTRSYF